MTKRAAHPIKGLLFDLDGTLVPTTAHFYRAWITTARAFGLSTKVRYSRFIRQSHLPAEQLVDNLFGAVPSGQVATMQSMVSSQMQHALAKVEPSNGALPLLARSRLAGLKVGIVTNSPEPRVSSILRTLRSRNKDILPFVEAIICPTSRMRPKPAPDLYLAGANELSLRPEDCIAVDDSDDGIQAASSARIHAIQLVTTTSPTRDDELNCKSITKCNSLYDLQRLLADWTLL